MSVKKEKRVPRWYFGGAASTVAASTVHPLDLLKVHLQTQQKGKLTLITMAKHIVQKQGFFALYNGISASILRQLTYSLARFGLYDISKQHVKSDTLLTKLGIAGMAGAVGGFVGNPADMVNVRMQNDIKLPKEQRRNYSNALHGLYCVYKEGGIQKLWTGTTATCTRAAIMTIGQLVSYDQIKMLLQSTGQFEDTVPTHLLCSVIAGSIATAMTQPIDVVKTRTQNAKPGQTLFTVITATASEGPQAFYKGFIPSFIRIVPATVILFAIAEQLRIHFGKIVEE